MPRLTHRRGPGLLLFGLVVSCASGDPEVAADSTEVDEEEFEDVRQVRFDEPLEAPPTPNPVSGRLVTFINTRAQPEYHHNGAWPARAVRCEEPPTIHVLARGDGFGAAVIMALPDSGPPTMAYEMEAGEEGVPTPGSARLGVQIYPEDRGFTFRGVRGTVELTEIDGRVGGRFTVWAAETSFRDTVAISAVFAGVPMDIPRTGECVFVGADEDSTVTGPARP